MRLEHLYRDERKKINIVVLVYVCVCVCVCKEREGAEGGEAGGDLVNNFPISHLVCIS